MSYDFENFGLKTLWALRCNGCVGCNIVTKKFLKNVTNWGFWVILWFLSCFWM